MISTGMMSTGAGADPDATALARRVAAASPAAGASASAPVYRPLGASDLHVPAIGIGTAAWGERLMGYNRSYSRYELMLTWRACLDAGLTFFDTAEGYGRGESERLLGACAREDGRPVLIASKYAPAGRFAPSALRSSGEALSRALDRSLRRLGLERIDLYQVHYPTAPERVDLLMDAMAQAVRAGKVRAVGVSNYNAALMRRAYARLAQHGVPLASNQVRYNLLARYPETNGLLDACRELNVSLIAYSPLEQGVLTGKFRSGEAVPTLAQRLYFRLLQLDLFGESPRPMPPRRRWLDTPRALRRESLEPLFAVLDAIAQARQVTMAQVALNWLMCGPVHVLPIPGAKRPRQAREHAAAAGWRLTNGERARLDAASSDAFPTP